MTRLAGSEPVITSFRHKGRARLYQRAGRRGVAADVEGEVEGVLVGLGVWKLADHLPVHGH